MNALVPLAVVQAALGARVLARLARTAPAAPIAPAAAAPAGAVSVIVPVLDEEDRLAPALAALVATGPEVREILVVDGGSRDGTEAIVARAAARDTRVRTISAAPIPAGWNGKAWGLEVGLAASDPRATWILTIDADVRPQPGLVAALVAHARRHRLGALSVATRQELADATQAVVHPAMLATLVYRFGAPGGIAAHVGEVQANGQCFLARRDVLLRTGAFARARRSRCEDVTAARTLVAAGERVGFFETDDLVRVRMHADWRATWRDWPRSLPLHDEHTRISSLIGIAEMALVQALPIPLALGLALAGRRRNGFALGVNTALACARIGIAAGTRRAYVDPPATYWLAPLADLAVVGAIVRSMAKRRHVWRGRELVTGDAA